MGDDEASEGGLMALRILVVDDAFADQTNLVLAGAGGRNMPATAVPPASVAPNWESVLSAGAFSGFTSPQMAYTIPILFWGDILNSKLGGWLGIDAGLVEFSLQARAAGGLAYGLKLRGADNPGGAGGPVTIVPGSGPLGNSFFQFETIAWGPAIYGDGSGLSFWDGAPAHKPSVIGAKAGNVALQNLLLTLANMGLITDNTT
jgi:hypothetical protein